MNITMVIRRSDKDKSLELLRMFGVPFKGQNDEQ